MAIRRLLCVGAAVGSLAGCAEIKEINRSLNAGEVGLRFLLEGRMPGIDVTEVRPGVAYGKWVGEGPVAVHVLAIDLRRPELALRPILGHDRIDGGTETKETLASMARRTGALAAINGDYSSTLINVAGLNIIDGRINFAPRPPPERSALVIGRDRKVWMGPLHPDSSPGPDYYQAIGGGPILVSSGTFRWQREGGRLNGENFGKADLSWDERSAWTVVGLSKDRMTMFWIVVLGPAWFSVGMNPQELSKVLAQLQVGEAMRFEGGRASGMALDGKAVGLPPGEDIPQMPLGSALGLYAPR